MALHNVSCTPARCEHATRHARQPPHATARRTRLPKAAGRNCKGGPGRTFAAAAPPPRAPRPPPPAPGRPRAARSRPRLRRNASVPDPGRSGTRPKAAPRRDCLRLGAAKRTARLELAHAAAQQQRVPRRRGRLGRLRLEAAAEGGVRCRECGARRQRSFVLRDARAPPRGAARPLGRRAVRAGGRQRERARRRGARRGRLRRCIAAAVGALQARAVGAAAAAGAHAGAVARLPAALPAAAGRHCGLEAGPAIFCRRRAQAGATRRRAAPGPTRAACVRSGLGRAPHARRARIGALLRRPAVRRNGSPPAQPERCVWCHRRDGFPRRRRAPGAPGPGQRARGGGGLRRRKGGAARAARGSGAAGLPRRGLGRRRADAAAQRAQPGGATGRHPQHAQDRARGARHRCAKLRCAPARFRLRFCALPRSRARARAEACTGVEDRSNAALERFLRARKYDVPVAAAMYLEHRRWRAAFSPTPWVQGPGNVANQLAQCKVAMQGLCHDGLPFVIVVARNHRPTGKEGGAQPRLRLHHGLHHRRRGAGRPVPHRRGPALDDHCQRRPQRHEGCLRRAAEGLPGAVRAQRRGAHALLLPAPRLPRCAGLAEL